MIRSVHNMSDGSYVVSDLAPSISVSIEVKPLTGKDETITVESVRPVDAPEFERLVDALPTEEAIDIIKQEG